MRDPKRLDSFCDQPKTIPSIKITADYSKEQYMADLASFSMYEIWTAILLFLRDHGGTEFLKEDMLSNLYELGLSIKNKSEKKESGVYYTPKDVSDLMADFLIDFLDYDINICDVCAGTGNLIMSVLHRMDTHQRNKYLREGRVFLYDIDPLALKIAVNRIGFSFGYQYMDNIHIISGDFLNTDVTLPERSIVISNPPYFKIREINESWEKTPLLLTSKEYYGVFMEKCIKQAQACVFITPYSFVNGTKFFELRKLLNETRSSIFVFDNVPGNIFKGKKHGIFNTNTANSTRAAITITDKQEQKGSVVTPMIRFSTSERSRILNRSLLESLLNKDHYQQVSNEDPMYYKCYPEDIPALLQWMNCPQRFGDLLSKEPTEYSLDMPTTCRYFTVATTCSLTREGKYVLYFHNQSERDYAYILLNSSFAYWYWRIYDGAITYSMSLLKTMPINYVGLSESLKKRLRSLFLQMSEEESNYLTYKKNANKIQENVKFDSSFRTVCNHILSEAFNIKTVDFDRIHRASFFKTDGYFC